MAVMSHTAKQEPSCVRALCLRSRDEPYYELVLYVSIVHACTYVASQPCLAVEAGTFELLGGFRHGAKALFNNNLHTSSGGASPLAVSPNISICSQPSRRCEAKLTCGGGGKIKCCTRSQLEIENAIRPCKI